MATKFWKWKADGQVVTGLAELRRSNAQMEWRNPEPIWFTSQNPRPSGIGAAGNRGWRWSWIQEDVVKIYWRAVRLRRPGLPGDWRVLLWRQDNEGPLSRRSRASQMRCSIENTNLSPPPFFPNLALRERNHERNHERKFPRNEEHEFPDWRNPPNIQTHVKPHYPEVSENWGQKEDLTSLLGKKKEISFKVLRIRMKLCFSIAALEAKRQLITSKSQEIIISNLVCCSQIIINEMVGKKNKDISKSCHEHFLVKLLEDLFLVVLRGDLLNSESFYIRRKPD